MFNMERKEFPLLYVHQHSRGIVGWGASRMAGQECQVYGIKHALLVTTGLKNTGIGWTGKIERRPELSAVGRAGAVVTR